MFIEFYHMVTKQDLFKYVYPSSMLTLSQLRTEDIFNPQGGKKKQVLVICTQIRAMHAYAVYIDTRI